MRMLSGLQLLIIIGGLSSSLSDGLNDNLPDKEKLLYKQPPACMHDDVSLWFTVAVVVVVFTYCYSIILHVAS